MTAQKHLGWSLLRCVVLSGLALSGSCASESTVPSATDDGEDHLGAGATPDRAAAQRLPGAPTPTTPADPSVVPAPPGVDPPAPPSPQPAPGPCASPLVGWASVSGDGVATTTGGGSAAPVRPRNAAELVAFAGDATPRVIELTGSFNVPKLQVASNKTIVGVGPSATIHGGVAINGKKDAHVKNVILRNVHVNGASSQASGDAINIQFAHHVWIDHVDVYDGPDGSLDMSHAVNWVTVSWTKVRYTPAYRSAPGEEVAQHRFASLVGHSDDNSGEDTNRLKVTYHHNWWAERVLERMPRARFGQVHVFNNYFSSSGNNYCVRAGRGAQILVEGNAFEGVKSPHQFNNANDQRTANITARNNSYVGVSGDRATGGGGAAFTRAPYAATIDPPGSVAAAVRACAGPR